MSTSTIDPKAFHEALGANGIDLYTGVPDSLLQDLCACIEASSPRERHLITANEGNAVAIACGYHVATGRYAAVYLQNSGLGNTVNPLLSLADPDVYGIPMLLIVGWRGEPGVDDEPQHIAQGRLTLPLLETLGVDHIVLDPQNWTAQVADAVERLRSGAAPVALVVRKGTFSRYSAASRPSALTLTREQALEAVVNAVGPAFIVSTTGKTSRELFEIRERRGEGHSRDFLTVGGMGHAASIALGMSLGTDEQVFCIDGDGAFLMHMGSLAVVAQHARDNFRYILINNGAHESVGGQPTVAFDIQVDAILSACGFESVETVATAADLPGALARLASAAVRAALVVQVAQGSRAELGRPTVAPRQNKLDMARLFAGGGDT